MLNFLGGLVLGALIGGGLIEPLKIIIVLTGYVIVTMFPDKGEHLSAIMAIVIASSPLILWLFGTVYFMMKTKYRFVPGIVLGFPLPAVAALSLFALTGVH